MIGVECQKNESEVVKEFFELFKTPWEFCNPNKTYDVIISTKPDSVSLKTKLFILFSTDNTSFDTLNNIQILSPDKSNTLAIDLFTIPLYTAASTLTSNSLQECITFSNKEPAGLILRKKEQTILRIGYNIFNETAYLLSQGQPASFANIPTLDLHIALLRKWILQEGIPVVEIPPLPAGYSGFCCLTHDVDYSGIRNHFFDHTLAGFIYRATIVSVINFIKKRLPFEKLIKNLLAVLSLPLIYCKLLPDFWAQLEKYTEIEGNNNSTFFMIPFKNTTGLNVQVLNPSLRSTKYDITDIKKTVKLLMNRGAEIGVHGLDSWHNVEKAKAEKKRITDVTGQTETGVRMHWLYFDDQSFNILDKAGFLYDSTFGYNDTIGFRAGTLQPFRPSGVTALMELPMHIQDTALFNKKRMNLGEKQAHVLCDNIIEFTTNFGGALTILWHERSLAPERLYDTFYKDLIAKLKKERIWFGTASYIVNWFKQRRSIRFESVAIKNGIVIVSLNTNGKINMPNPLLRVYHIPNTENKTISLLDSLKAYKEMPIMEQKIMEIQI